MKNQITTILTVCGALLASATTASAFMGGKEAGSICIFGQDVHCWIDPATYSWQKDHPAFAENEDTGTVIGETEVAMMTPEMLKAWNDSVRYYSTELNSTEEDGGAPVRIAMWGNHGGNIFDGNAWKNFWSKENWHVGTPELTITEDTQFAHHNACGQFNCKTDEVEAPIYSDVLATTEFGNCLLNDAPVDIESLVDCRSDACLGRKFYYGL